jgi:hypothetical protein
MYGYSKQVFGVFRAFPAHITQFLSKMQAERAIRLKNITFRGDGPSSFFKTLSDF